MPYSQAKRGWRRRYEFGAAVDLYAGGYLAVKHDRIGTGATHTDAAGLLQMTGPAIYAKLAQFFCRA